MQSIMPTRRSECYINSESRDDDSDDLARALEASLNLQPGSPLYEQSHSNNDPYHPLLNSRSRPRAESGYNSREQSAGPVRDFSRYEPEVQLSYRTSRFTDSAYSSSNNISSARSTGQQTPSSRRSDGRPPRERPIYNNSSVIHNDSRFQDDLIRRKGDDPRYYKGSEFDTRRERREPEPRPRRRPGDLRYYKDDHLEEDEEEEEDE